MRHIRRPARAARNSVTGTAAEFARYLRTETIGGMVLLAAAVVALTWANSPVRDSYQAMRET
ncbi:MAG TPA: Na+/H+ antiporter NhaA, partial [Pseudonocardia sp.]|uniref:Na+/H+ antiporter NhaA n=1 Tax=Pseudonocardia sp. TaxID=60912 RepID=UPI002B9F0F59